MPTVNFWAEVGDEKREWKGKVVRSEGGVDRSSRSVYLIAEVTATPEEQDRFLQTGLFVKAKVSGVSLENVFRIPRVGIYEGDRVLMIDEKNQVHFRDVKVKRSESTHVLVSEGLKAGDRICLTPLAGVVEGMEVKVVSDDEKAEVEAEIKIESPANT